MKGWTTLGTKQLKGMLDLERKEGRAEVTAEIKEKIKKMPLTLIDKLKLLEEIEK